MFEIGSIHLRSELHALLGGNPRAGICPTKSGITLVFSDPRSGTPFGYDQNDYVLDDVYHYTGEGRVGDQQFLRGNKAMLETELWLFARVDRQSWVFVGEVELADPKFLLAEAPDQNQAMRQVIVFRLQEKRANFELLRN